MTDPTVRGARSVPATEPRHRSKIGFILGVLLLIVVAAIVVAVVLAGRNTDDAKSDVSVTGCQTPAGGGKPKASGRITNHSSKTSNYVVKIKFKDAAGNAVSEGAAPVQSLDANKAATWELTGDRDVKGSVTCDLTGVSRTHLPGQ